MTEWMFLLLDAAAGGVRIMVCLLLVFRLLQTKKPERKCLGAALAGAAATALAACVLELPDLFRGALEVGWIAVCAAHFQEADVRMSLFLGIYCEITAYLWQFLLGAGLGVLFSSGDFLNRATGSGQAASWLLHGGLILLALYVVRHPSVTGKEAFRPASAFAVAGLLAVITLSEQRIPWIGEDRLDTWTILSAVVLMYVQVFHINWQYRLEKELAALKSRQAELLERDYRTLNRAYAVNARLFHDFHNHLGVLRQFLSHERYGEALQYLDELHAPVREMRDAVWTEDETVDYLINEKTARAKAGGIDLKVQVEFPRRTNLGSADLCAILGNLLDNALEAAGQVSEPESRFIRLTIRRIHQMLVIKLENSFAGRPVMEDGMPKTTKENNGLHGWGLKSVQTAAEKYDGMVQTSYTDGLFRTVVTLSYEGISAEGQV